MYVRYVCLYVEDVSPEEWKYMSLCSESTYG